MSSSQYSEILVNLRPSPTNCEKCGKLYSEDELKKGWPILMSVDNDPQDDSSGWHSEGWCPDCYTAEYLNFGESAYTKKGKLRHRDSID